MNVYITDNPEIHKTLGGESFLAYQLYDWRVLIEVTDAQTGLIERDVKRRAKRRAVLNAIRNNDTVIAIVAPSNYKLIYDLMFTKKNFGKELKLYSWDGWACRTPLPFLDSWEAISKEFENYLRRGYLSLKLFQELAYYNFTRIEQFFIVLKIAFLNSQIQTGASIGCPIKYEAMLPHLSYAPKSFILGGEEKVSLLGMIRVLSFLYKSFSRVIDKLTYHARRNDITDPFSGDFIFLNDKNSLFKIYQEHKNSDLYLGNEISSKFLKKNKAGITFVISELCKIIPLCDVLKSLRYLSLSNALALNEEGVGFDIFTELSASDLQRYEAFYDEKVWQSAYKSFDYSFIRMFPNIGAILPMFRCPLCSVNHFVTFPRYFSCTNPTCSFRFPRIVKPGGIAKPLTELDFLKLIHHGSADIKNARGGHSKYALFRYEGNKFRAIPVMKANKADE